MVLGRRARVDLVLTKSANSQPGERSALEPSPGRRPPAGWAGRLMSMKGTDPPRSAELAAQISAVAALNEPVRRALYTYILQKPEAVGREEAARAVGITRELAA